jgi:TRAP-type C4-dicarboxylate transport system substrate-binding protein
LRQPFTTNEETFMSKRTTIKTLAAAVALGALASLSSTAVHAQQKLKWAHVYETSEPYHTESVWAAEEIKKRTNGKFDIQVFPASSLGKETDINQGLTLGTVDMIISGPSLPRAPIRASALPTIPSSSATGTT